MRCVTIRLPQDVYRRLRVMAAETDSSVRAVVQACVEVFLEDGPRERVVERAEQLAVESRRRRWPHYRRERGDG